MKGRRRAAEPRLGNADRAGHRKVWLGSLLVWSVLALLALQLLVHLVVDVRNIPLAEDWLLVASLTDNEPDFWSWVWAQNNEHRSPIARLLYLALLEVGQDFRVGALFDILLMTSIAGACVLVTRKLRGHGSWVDVFFPLLLLHLGNWENLLWSWQIQFVIVVAAVIVLLLMIVRSPLPMSVGRAAALAAIVGLLPLGGGTALPMVPIGIIVSLLLGSVPGTPRWTRRLLLLGAVSSLLLTGLYFVDWHRPTWYPENPGLVPTAYTSAIVFVLGWGPAIKWVWQWAVVGAFSFFAVCAVLLGRAALRGPIEDRQRARSLGCYLVGILAAAGALGYGRAALAPTLGFPDRYVYVTLPGWLAVWFVWQLYGPVRIRRWGQVLLASLAMLALPWNMAAGERWREWYVTGMRAVEADLDSGVSSRELAERHFEFLLHWDQPGLAARLQMLREADFGPFGDRGSGRRPSSRAQAVPSVSTAGGPDEP